MSALSTESVSDLLRSLIAIPSVNPDGNPGTDQTGEGALALALADWLTAAGAETELRDVLPGRPNLLARFPSTTPGKPRILFAPHTDTVSVVGMVIDPFGGELRDGKIFGRGATDTKGPMAAMLWAIRSLGSELANLPYEIWFAGLMNEEAGLQGSSALASQERFDFVIVGEPTDLQIVHATKGAAQIYLQTSGTAVHASQPETGENAIYAMADLIAIIRSEVTQKLNAQVHGVLGSPTISVGTIEGGSKGNIVPDFCRAEVDLRTIPGQSIESVLELLRSAAPNATITSRGYPAFATDIAHPLIRLMQECGAEACGAPWFCDAAMFANSGSPAIAIGPGSINQAHTKDEFIRVSDLEAGVAFFQRFLRALKSPAPPQ